MKTNQNKEDLVEMITKRKDFILGWFFFDKLLKSIL